MTDMNNISCFSDAVLEERLIAMEDAHARAAGGKENFCYHPISFSRGSLYILAYVRRNTAGYWPISEDYFMGTEVEMKTAADELNNERLDMGPRETARLVASSMVAN